jgi:hypothetical protein
MEIIHFNQRSLAKRWDVSEASLERWRSEGIGPMFLKLQGRVLYRLVDIEAYEESCLSISTKRLDRKISQPERALAPVLPEVLPPRQTVE